MTTIKDNVILLACGGTIDKIYFDAKSSYSVGAPASSDILKRGGVQLPPPRSITKKDSLDMTDDDRAAVAAAVLACDGRRIVVTHGTDTMADTARAVASSLSAAAEKTVVFVGSFLPAVFRDSDADFNLGFAIAAALAMPAGVYVAMNGRIIPAAAARKNRAAGRFEDKDEKA